MGGTPGGLEVGHEGAAEGGFAGAGGAGDEDCVARCRPVGEEV